MVSYDQLAFPKGLTSAPGRPRVAANSPVVFDVSLEYIPGLEFDEEWRWKMDRVAISIYIFLLNFPTLQTPVVEDEIPYVVVYFHLFISSLLYKNILILKYLLPYYKKEQTEENISLTKKEVSRSGLTVKKSGYLNLISKALKFNVKLFYSKLNWE